jgi:hypothetical protein
VQKKFENNLSLEKEICAKCARGSRTCEVPKTMKSSIVGGDRWQKIERSGSECSGRFAKRKQRSSWKSRRAELILVIGAGKGMWKRSMDFRGRTLREIKSRRRTPEELGMKKSWPSIEIGHVELDSSASLIHKSGETEIGEVKTP